MTAGRAQVSRSWHIRLLSFGTVCPLQPPGTEQICYLRTSLGRARRRPQQIPVRGGGPFTVLAEVLIPGGHEELSRVRAAAETTAVVSAVSG